MIGKIEIIGKIKVLTGMHIGGSSEFSAIGAVDSPVIKDTLTGSPFIPGSSLKGKLRYLLAEELSGDSKINSHNDDPKEVLRLFGSSADKDNLPIRSRLYFSDMYISNEEELKDSGIKTLTEVKFENTIDRSTAKAMPRQIERVIRGTEFDLSIIYNVENLVELEEDFENIKLSFDLLKYDYLGGSGSRGYGRVDIEDLKADLVVGDLSDEYLEKIEEIMK